MLGNSASYVLRSWQALTRLYVAARRYDRWPAGRDEWGTITEEVVSERAVPHAATAAFARPGMSGSDAGSFIAAPPSLQPFNWGRLQGCPGKAADDHMTARRACNIAQIGDNRAANTCDTAPVSAPA